MLHSHETELVGSFKIERGSIENDPVTNRIYELLHAHLIEVARSPEGWTRLYRDPSDSRLWELSFPQGSLQGGGPPRLAVLSKEEALSRYQFEGGHLK